GSVVLVEQIDDNDNDAPLWRAHDIALLESAHDAKGRKFKVVRVRAPRWRYWKGKSETFAACYLNAYVANGAVIGARFGDTERDDAAQRELEKAFCGGKVILLSIDRIANGSGGVHWLTQPMPTP